MSSVLAPQNIELVGDQIAIAWSDGQETFLSLQALRRACPCAACGGEPDLTGRVARPTVSYGPKSFLLRGWKLVGGYAFQPTWQDGHDTGLYTYAYLRQLPSSP
jgi:DUF971 family protein